MTLPGRFQVAKSLSVNASVVTSNPWFIGDFRAVTVSISTQSAHATIVQLSNEDGFATPILESSWSNALSLVAPGVFNITPAGARWSRISSPSASSATIIFSGLPL